MCQFTPDLNRSRETRTDPADPTSNRRRGESPDRCDALVWGFTELLVEQGPGMGVFELYRREAEARKAAEEAKRNARPEYEPALGSLEWIEWHRRKAEE